MPKEGSQYICLSVILLDSIFRTGKNYYPKVLLEECKYFIKEKKIHKYIIDDVEISSDSGKETLLEKIQMEKSLIMKKILMRKFWKKIRWKKIQMKKILVKTIKFLSTYTKK